MKSTNTKTSLTMGSFVIIEWKFLLFGILMAFWSSLGQTFFISLFSYEIRSELDLSHGEFGTYYAIATSLSALTLLWLGKLADTMSVEKLALFVLVWLIGAAVVFSQITGILTLVIALYLLRLFGQGMMTHVYTTAIARRYTAFRGRAISVAQLGHTLGESTAPVTVVALLALSDWRNLWLGIPLIALFTVAPWLRYLTQRTELQDGCRTSEDRVKNEAVVSSEMSHQWRRSEVLRDPTFWFGLLWLTAVPSFVLTAILFHQIHFATIKGVSMSAWTANYIFYAIFAVFGALLIGQLIDRFSAKKVAAFTLTPNGLACLVLWLSPVEFGIPVFFIFFGLAIGFPHATNAALIAELYGTKYIGEIKALFLPVVVFASALSPMFLGLMIDMGAGLAELMLLNIFFTFGAQIMVMLSLHFRKT